MQSPAVAHVAGAFDSMSRRYKTIVDFRADRSEPSSSFLIQEFRARVMDGLKMGDVENVVTKLQTIHHKHSFIIQKCNCANNQPRSLDVAAVFLCEEALVAGRDLVYQAELEASRCCLWRRR